MITEEKEVAEAFDVIVKDTPEIITASKKPFDDNVNYRIRNKISFLFSNADSEIRQKLVSKVIETKELVLLNLLFDLARDEAAKESNLLDFLKIINEKLSEKSTYLFNPNKNLNGRNSYLLKVFDQITPSCLNSKKATEVVIELALDHQQSFIYHLLNKVNKLKEIEPKQNIFAKMIGKGLQKALSGEGKSQNAGKILLREVLGGSVGKAAAEEMLEDSFFKSSQEGKILEEMLSDVETD